MDARMNDIRAADEVRVERAEALRLEIPLTSPYENALGTLNRFDAVVFRMTGTDGTEGWGEACPVAGYSPETPAEAWDFAREILPVLIGRGHGEIGSILEERLVPYPFVVSALNEALADMRGEFDPATSEDGPEAIELLGTVNTLDALRAPDLACALLAKGYRTLKVKVGYTIRPRMPSASGEYPRPSKAGRYSGSMRTKALPFGRPSPSPRRSRSRPSRFSSSRSPPKTGRGSGRWPPPVRCRSCSTSRSTGMPTSSGRPGSAVSRPSS
jgi:Mandelate racemase / muconate lactonizing enzyme, N-terminal domain